MPRAAVTANSALASLGRYWRDSRPRHCSRADIPAWRPQKSHYCIIITRTNISRHLIKQYTGWVRALIRGFTHQRHHASPSLACYVVAIVRVCVSGGRGGGRGGERGGGGGGGGHLDDIITLPYICIIYVLGDGGGDSFVIRIMWKGGEGGGGGT